MSPAQYASKDGSALGPFDPQSLVRHQPDAHWILTESTDRITARVSLWWTNVPRHPSCCLGLLGHFAATDPLSAKAVLGHAVDQLLSHGCTLAVAPMDGNTWRHYRLLTQRAFSQPEGGAPTPGGVEPPFLFEPDNPDEWPRWFADCGFSPLATYFSALADDLALVDSRIPKAVERLKRNGVQWRPLEPTRFIEELRRIYKVASIAFRDNFLYTPISEAEFVAQYQMVREHNRAELVLIAEHAGQPVGFVFAVPDLLQAKLGPVDTVIVKTVAVLPGRAYAGLGNVLVAACHEAARELGFRRAIHALMHETNNSLNLSAHYTKPFRRYTLFARSLR